MGGEPSTDAGAGGVDSGGNSGGGGTGGSAGTAGTAGTGAVSSCPVGLPGPPLLEITSPGGDTYCIDRTEVESGTYADFLDTSPDVADQTGECTWNTSFAPEMSADCDPLPFDPDGEPSAAVSCVDWCDAKKFCEWAGKELCGGFDGSAVAPTSFADAEVDAWYHACSMNGANEFPYGDTYEDITCAGLDSDETGPVRSSSYPDCEGGYPGLFGMSGNVSEWEDSCDASNGASDGCLHRGGGYFDYELPPESLRCNSSGANDDTPTPAVAPRDMRRNSIGIRCCLSP
jgi:formylglycine-generating enzyme